MYSGKVKKADGTKAKNGTNVQYADGRCETLLNPSGKGRKYAAELSQKAHVTNTGDLKVDKGGKVQRLTDTQAAWRGGYLQAQKDAAAAYKSTHGGKKSGRTKSDKGGF